MRDPRVGATSQLSPATVRPDFYPRILPAPSRAVRLSGALVAAALLLAACGPHEVRYPRGGPDCPRGQARPLLNRRNRDVLSVTFKRTALGRAVETARLRGNIRLTIRHSGCDRRAQTFEFELRGRPRPLERRAYWYRRAAALLAVVSSASPDAAGLRLIAGRLKSASAEAPPYGAPLPMDDYQALSLQVQEGGRGQGTQVRVRYALKL